LGITRHISKWIFVGAKQSDKKREQEIKGVIAHELCHYVMCLVYNNNYLPYFKDSNDLRDKFDKIVKEINKWSETKSNDPDDECNKIISSVFTAYVEKQFHYELIVRTVHLLAQYDDHEEKTKHLQEKYKILFEFWSNQVIPELQRYLQKNLEIIELNGILDLLPCITKLKYELCDGKDMENMMNKKVVIVQSNVPKLLFLNILKYLQQKCGNLFDSQNIFTEPEKLTNVKLWNKFQKICSDNRELRIFVDCSKEVPDYLGEIFINKDPSFIFVVSTDEQTKKLSEIFIKKSIESDAKMEINYNWNDLMEESKKLLLETKINFQNNPQVSLMDLLKVNVSAKEPTTSRAVEINKTESNKDLREVIDDQLLNLVLENQKVLINTKEKDENSEKYFQLLFIQRDFIKKTRENDEECELGNKSSDDPTEDEKPTWSYAREKKFLKIKTQRIFKDELLSEVKNQKYVLISDEAGNGKSWAMKNFTNILREQNPTSWVTYVDLKQFIDEIKAQKGEPEFSSFLIEKILKIKLKFEAKIFKKMYKNGKVLILFDGFDEIAPNYAEFVSKLAQNFQQNGGNQLWIATRDYFEVDLQKKLKLDVAYRLEEMDEDEGVDLIIKSWILMDLKDESEPKSKEEFEMFLEMSPKYESYRQKAYHIIRKALISRNNSVGLPQFYKMIADGFKDVSDVSNLQGLKIYAEFIDILYKRWCKKGQIREEANVKCQHFVLNFHKFHQYQAILSLFPELAPILFPGYNGSEWPEEEVIACGILTKINGKYYFIHETFREYHVADAIANALKNDEVAEKVLETLDEVLTEDKFEIIRKFLFPVLNEPSILEKVKPLIEKAVYCERNFGQFFTENLENLVDFAIDVLKNGNYGKALAALNETAQSIASSTQSSIMFPKFQNFIINFLKVDDLKKLIIKGQIFQEIIRSSPEIEIFEEFMKKTESKTDREFIRQGLVLASDGCRNEYTIFYNLSLYSNLNAHKVNKVLEIMEKFFTSAEILELMSKCDEAEQNVLQVCVESEKEENLKILWTGIEIYFAKQNPPQNFKEFIKQGDILDSAVRCNNIDIHGTLWELLFKTFENREELKDFILTKNYYENNFLHELVEDNKNPAIIDLTFKKLKENFSEAQLKEILTSKDSMEMNLLQYAACSLEVTGVHQILWKFFRDFCGTDGKFLEMLKEVDEYGQNILHSAARKSSGEVFEFMIQELEKSASRDEIREILRNLDDGNKNLLQAASEYNKSSEFHKTLWKTFHKYFEKSEIVEFIKHVDKYGNNLLHIAVEWNTEEIVELTWNKIKSFLNHDEQVEYLKLKGKDGQNILHIAISNSNSPNEVFEFLIQELEKIASRDEIREMLRNLDNYNKNLLQAASRRNISSELYKTLWKTFHKYFENSEIVEFMKHVDIFGNNLLFNVVSNNNKEIVELTWNKIKSFLNHDEQVEYLKLKEKDGQNIFHNAISNSSSEVFDFVIQELEKSASRDEIKKMLRNLDNKNQNLLQAASRWTASSEFHKTLWKALRKYLEKSEIVEFIKQVDKYGNNLLHIAVEWNTEEIVELTWNEIKSFLNHDEQVEYLKLKGDLIKISLESHYYNREMVIKWVKTQLENYKINL